MHSTEISLPARRSSLPELLDWLSVRNRHAGLPDSLGQHLQLVVEELFANTLEHGFAGESDTPVTVAFACDPECVHLRYIDHAPLFDLTAAAPLPVDGERLGGFGLNLVRALSSAQHYRRGNGCNILDMDFRRPSDH